MLQVQGETLCGNPGQEKAPQRSLWVTLGERKPRAALLPGRGALGTARLVYGLRSMLRTPGCSVCEVYFGENFHYNLFPETSKM